MLPDQQQANMIWLYVLQFQKAHAHIGIVCALALVFHELEVNCIISVPCGNGRVQIRVHMSHHHFPCPQGSIGCEHRHSPFQVDNEMWIP